MTSFKYTSFANLSHVNYYEDRGLARGIKQGRAQGFAQGIEETARRALAKGIPVDTIQEITGLDMEAIKGLQTGG